MKKTLVYLFALVIQFANPANAQVAALPYVPGLDSFNVFSGITVDYNMADDVVFSNIPIGFDFYYGGALHQKMSISTNGFIELDTTSSSFWINILSGVRNNIIAPFGADLRNSGSNSSLQYTVTGTAPNRICIIQWLHYTYFAGQADINFQIKLYETSNCIKFVYGTTTLLTNPLNTQIGLRGSNNLDFLVLGDTVCSWANAFPYPLITTLFPVSLNCSMPSGFAFNFGSCNGGNANFGFLDGSIFIDDNGNGFLDNNESPIANKIVNMQPGNYFVSSNTQGNYTFFFVDSTLTYSLSTAPILYWNQTTLPTVLTCNPASQSTKDLDFGFQPIPNIHEVSVYCPNWNAKPGQPEPMPISYHNNGTAVESDTIVLEMDSLYSFISATPAPLLVNGKTITWVYSNLQPGQSGSIMLYLLPDSNAVMGNYLDSKLTIGPVANDTVPANNLVALHQLIANSWDPNDKLAEPAGIIKAGDKINYTIRFQNTGTASADNVTILDTLDANLDLLSFKLLGASHSVNFTMEGNGIARFTFYNIQLPDSGTDLAGSNGAVWFSINAKANLLPLTIINNTAGIYFDFNPAVITNTTADTIANILSVGDVDGTSKFAIALPNPASNLIIFNSNDGSSIQAVSIYNTVGQLCLDQQIASPNSPVNISQLSNGTYVAKIVTDKDFYQVKFIKQ
ncbi:MAG: T9SS type A sorting domain-containing protein [Bacteroidetes bacterium]|nr:T9SS type A sorting domain-containing protein [Bacteroidota bacterium]